MTPDHELVVISTIGALAMSRVIALCRNDPDFPNTENDHCMIYLQALAEKVLYYFHVMTPVVITSLVHSCLWRPTFSRRCPLVEMFLP